MPSRPPFRHDRSASDSKVAIVGGGLAGIAAAAALARQGLAVTLYESRSELGGRACSFRDPHTGDTIDYCQHVSMGCCSYLAELTERLGIAAAFQRESTLHFLGPGGRHQRLAASRWLPAPLHLLPALFGLHFLSWRERRDVAIGIARLARDRRPEQLRQMSIARWLTAHGQSSGAVEKFWAVVLISALADSLDRVSAWSARQVFVEGFLARRDAYHLLVPRAPLSELFGRRTRERLTGWGVDVRLTSVVREVARHGPRLSVKKTDAGEPEAYSHVVLAVPWYRVAELLAAPLAQSLPRLGELVPSTITGVHLWYDRPLTELRHAVLLDRTAQWIFRPAYEVCCEPEKSAAGDEDLFYYQAVISGSQGLLRAGKEVILRRICDDLRSVFPAAREARLRHARVVSDRFAVFSPRPGVDALRPPQQTGVPGLLLAGDWTATGWPATMESAVRSGYTAAQAILTDLGKPNLVVATASRSTWLSRHLLRLSG